MTGIKSVLADKQDDICPWCELPLPDELAYTTAVDHIIPRCRGGPDKRWNHQLLHLECNREKGKKLTPAAIELAAEHGIVLREPLPTAWPGSSVKHVGSGKPNPYRADPPAPPAADRPQEERMMAVNREKEWQQIQLNAQRELGNRADAIRRQPWRIWRNRRLRAEVRAIMAVVDPEWKPVRRPPQD